MNTLGMKTLLSKEVRRFLRVPGQTVLSPLISTTLYFVVFGYSLAGRVHEVDGHPYLAFIVPGLVFLGIANNAFLNSSSSLFITKIQGTVVDLLAAPLGPAELLFGFIGGGMVRGLLVGLLTWAVAALFTGVSLEHAPAVLFFLLLSSYVFSMLGLLAALWAEKFEQVNFFPTFVMLPLTFLGGVFYSAEMLPAPLRAATYLDPIFYAVDAFRFAAIGVSDAPPYPALGALGIFAVLSFWGTTELLRRGYKLRY